MNIRSQIFGFSIVAFAAFFIFSSSTLGYPVTREEFAAFHGGNCQVELITTGIGADAEEEEITSDTDWASHMLIKGEDGFLWKRAVITSHTDRFFLEEGEETRIYGTAPVGSVVQILFFPHVDNDPSEEIRAVQPPDSVDGICLQANDFTNKNALFFLSMADQFLWGAMGEDKVFDAFYRTDIPWETYMANHRSDSNNNILIGSHVFPKILTMGGEMEVPENCLTVCDGLTQGVILNRGQLPELFAIDQVLDDFDGAGIALIGRSDVHTYNAAYEGGGNNNPGTLRELTHKSLTMEILKRRLLGYKYPNYGSLDDGMQEITLDNLNDGIEGRGVEAETQELLLAIRAVLIDNSTDEPTIGARFLNRAQFFMNDAQMIINAPPVGALPPEPGEFPDNPLAPVGDYPQEPPGAGHPPFPPKIFTRGDGLFILEQVNAGGGEDTIRELFPLQQENIEGDLPITNENWAEVFIEILTFWTGRIDANLCLMEDDRFITSNFEDHGVGGDIGNVCEHPYVSGRTPTILLHTDEEIFLEPNFFDAVITKTYKFFTEKNGWKLEKGEKNPIGYEYEFTTEFIPEIVGEACVALSDVNEYSTFIQNKLGLFENEKEVLEKELGYLFDDLEFPHDKGGEGGFSRVLLASPQQISQRISWNGNGEKLDIFQLFFDARKGECVQKDFGILNLEKPLQKRDGFEAGVLKK